MYKLLNKTTVNGKELCIVKTNGGVSVMEKWEYDKTNKNYKNSLKK